MGGARPEDGLTPLLPGSVLLCIPHRDGPAALTGDRCLEREWCQTPAGLSPCEPVALLPSRGSLDHTVDKGIFGKVVLV